MRKLIALLVLVAASVFAYFGYDRYQHHRFIGALTPLVKNASLHVANSARYESESDAAITFKELFEKLATDVSELDKRLIDIQALSSPDTESITGPTVNYLKASQKYLRTVENKYRKVLAANTAQDWFRKILAEPFADTLYGLDYQKKQFEQARKDWETAREEINEATSGLLAAAKELKDARELVAQVFPQDALIPLTQLDSVIEKNLPARSGTGAASVKTQE